MTIQKDNVVEYVQATTNQQRCQQLRDIRYGVEPLSCDCLYFIPTLCIKVVSVEKEKTLIEGRNRANLIES